MPDPKLLEHPRQTLARGAIGGAETLVRRLERRQTDLVQTLLVREGLFSRWKASTLIIGYNNLGEIRFTWDGEREQGEVSQRLWWHARGNGEQLQSAV